MTNITILSTGIVLKNDEPANISYATNGYPMVAFNGEQHYVHRLVAVKFIPNPNGLRDVDHIDNNPLNNDVSNLRWLSHSDNIKRSTVGKRVLSFEDAIAIIRDPRKQREIAQDYDVNPSMIGHIKTGRSWLNAHKAIVFQDARDAALAEGFTPDESEMLGARMVNKSFGYQI